MGIKSFINNVRESFSGKTISIEESGFGLARIPQGSYLADTTEDSSRQAKLKFYKQAYLNEPVIYAAIETKVNQVVQEFWFEGPNKDRLMKEKDRLNMQGFMQNLSRTLFIYGDAFIETVREKTKIKEFKVLNPETMVVYTDPTGKEIGYGQVIEDKKLVLWGTTGNPQEDNGFDKKLPASKMEFISHFKLNPIAISKYGVSMIQPVSEAIEIKNSLEQDMKVVVKRYTAPLIHAKVGTDDRPALTSDVDAVAQVLEDITAQSEVVTSHLVSMDVLTFGGKGQDLKTPIDHINSEVVTGTNVPGILIGKPTGGERDAEVQLRNFGRHVKNIQRQIKTDVEDKLLQKQLGAKPDDKLVWGYVDEREEVAATSQLQGLVGQGIITQQKGNDLLPPKFQETLPKIQPQSNPNTPTPPGQPRGSQTDPEKLKQVEKPNDPTMSKKLIPGQRVKKSDIQAESVQEMMKMVKDGVLTT